MAVPFRQKFPAYRITHSALTMDNILEILVPLIFAAIYFFGNMFSGKSKEDEDMPPGMPRRRDSGQDEEPDVIERQRRIQEEIRRKIMERRRASSGDQPQVAPSGHELAERRQEVELRRESQESMDEPPPFATPSHQSEPEPPAFSWDESDNAYDQTIQARLEQIEATKRQAERLKKQVETKRKPVEGSRTNKRRSGGYFTGTVRESLQDPAAARVAFIYGEVLGQPVSTRKCQSVPGLS